MEENTKPQKPARGDRREFLKGAAVGASVMFAGGAAAVGAYEQSRIISVKHKGFSRARPIPSDTQLPKQVDVAIVGGGIAGVSTALALAERGVSVAVFEKGVVGGEASGRAGGLVECQLMAPEKMELVEYSKRRWRELAIVTGEDVGFLQRGSSVLFHDKEALAFPESWIESVKGLPNGKARMLSAKEAQAMAPSSPIKLAGGFTVPEDGTAEPVFASPGIALGARKHGAKIFQFCAVRGIERTGGRVSGVVTEHGTVKAQAVLVAGGVWTSMIGHDLGLDIPMLQCFAKGVSLLPFDGPGYGTASILQDTVLGWRKQPDGGYVIWEFIGYSPITPTVISRMFDLMPAMKANADALKPRFNLDTFTRWLRIGGPLPLDKPTPYEKTRIYEPDLITSTTDSALEHLQQAMPIFEHSAVRERWSGAMPVSLDNMPIISGVNSIPGLYVASGMLFGHTMGPGTGMVLADMITGKKPEIDVSRFTLDRFGPGKKIGYYA